MPDAMKRDNYIEMVPNDQMGDTFVPEISNGSATTLRQKAIDQMPSRKLGTLRVGTNVVCNIGVRNPRNSAQPNATYDNLLDIADPILLQQHALSIARELEKDENFMEDNPAAKQLRLNVLRDMPQCLYVKRAIKLHLEKSVGKTKSKPISFYKQLKYQLRITGKKINTSVNNFKYNYELWYGTLKQIEGNYGSGVATYFRFLRSIFIMNVMLASVASFLIVLPQFLHNSEHGHNSTESWKFLDFLTGEGFLTNSLLYYGNYANHSLVLFDFASYNMPFAYFLTMAFLYFICFLGISLDMAQSYRRNFIEASGGLKNVFAHKVFCGWDFSIVTDKTATLKHQTIYKELRELLSEDCKIKQPATWQSNFWTLFIRTTINALVACLLIVTAISMWTLLDRYHDTKMELLVDAPIPLRLNEKQGFALLTALSVTIFMNLFPKIFVAFAPYEKYSSPRLALYVTLIRTFLLGTIIVTVLMLYWLAQTAQECWETSLGQEVYRLIIMDFLFSLVVSFTFRICQYLIYTKFWSGIGAPQFDIAHNSLDLIYSQTLFWVGFYFSPLLPLVIVLKMFCQFYLQRTVVLYFCLPANKSWRAAQTNTVFLVMAFISLLCVLIVYAYILTKVPTTNCGPFKDYEYFYQMILQGIFRLKQENSFFKFLMYLTKPGIVGGVLIGMIGWVYYLRAKSNAQIAMVGILRDMLLLEAKDKEFLLSSITKVSDAEWMRIIDTPLMKRAAEWESSQWSFKNQDIQNI